MVEILFPNQNKNEAQHKPCIRILQWMSMAFPSGWERLLEFCSLDGLQMHVRRYSQQQQQQHWSWMDGREIDRKRFGYGAILECVLRSQCRYGGIFRLILLDMAVVFPCRCHIFMSVVCLRLAGVSSMVVGFLSEEWVGWTTTTSCDDDDNGDDDT